MSSRLHLWRLILTIAYTCLAWRSAVATYAPFLDQSFFFSWTPQTAPLPIPVAEQCDVLPISWGRQTATGPNPVAPYYLQVYTSTFLNPFIIPAGPNLEFDWAVPFSPDTLFQICMFDANGNTGGCQGIYTVIPSSNASVSCANVTYPSTSLGVKATVYNGPISQYGWIPQCTDLSITPTNGTPPYTLTIASTLHPPWNITSNSMAPINWTVALSWASAFFISIVDSGGYTWAVGPLHSGESVDPTVAPTCLSQISASNSTVLPTKAKGTSPAVTAGAAAGGVVAGLVIGLTAMYFCLRSSRRSETQDFPTLGKNASTTQLRPGTGGTSAYSAVPSTPMGSQAGTTLQNRTVGNYTIEPFRMPTEDGMRQHNSDPSPPIGRPASIAPSTHVQSEPDSQAGSSAAGRSGGTGTQDRSHVYVVHHDGGRAPVTVYTPDGTQVVELPPRYAEGSTMQRAESSGSGLQQHLNARRSVGATPRKAAVGLQPSNGPSSPS